MTNEEVQIIQREALNLGFIITAVHAEQVGDDVLVHAIYMRPVDIKLAENYPVGFAEFTSLARWREYAAQCPGYGAQA